MSVLTMSGEVCVYGVGHQVLLLGWGLSHTRHQIERGVVLATPGAAGCSHRPTPSVLQHGAHRLGSPHNLANRRTLTYNGHHLSTNKLMQQSHEKLTVPQRVNKSPPLMNPKSSLQCSKHPSTGSSHKPNKFNPHLQNLSLMILVHF
jgi:hypothetical protein